MIVRALPLLRNSTSQFLKGLRTASPLQMLKWNAQPFLNQASFLSTINLNELLINYQMPILTIMRRQLEEVNGETELDRAILNVSTFRRKKTKLKKAKKRQKRKKLRRLSERKRKKLNLI